MNEQLSTQTRDETRELPVVRPRTRRREDEDAYRVTVDLPGAERDAVEVRYEDQVLTIEAEVRRRPGPELRHVEFGPRRFRTSFRVGERVDADAIHARFEHGQLTVTLPRRAEAKPRTVSIEG